MTPEALQTLIDQGETAKVDYKREWYKSSKKNELKSEFVKDLLALSNGDIHTINDTAYLIIGVVDGSKEVYPFDDSTIPRSLDTLKKQLLEIINNYAQPEFLALDIAWVAYQDKEVLVLSVPPHGRLISLAKDLQLKKGTDKKGTVYYRIGEMIRVASADVVRDFEKAFGNNGQQNSSRNIEAKNYIEKIDNSGGTINFN